MNRALSDINEPHYTKRKFINSRSKAKRLLDSDIKEFAYIKWAKSAINLHNNNIGRLVSDMYKCILFARKFSQFTDHFSH